ncbi:MAG: VOC family protein [Thermoplasmata archaeon]
MGGEVVHFEIPSDNIERARRFYAKTFGWKMDALPDLDYTLVGTPLSDEDGVPTERGAINGGLLRRQTLVEVPVITIRVDDIDRVTRAIQKNGGRVLQEKSPIGDGSLGFVAYFADTEGNTVGLFQRNPHRATPAAGLPAASRLPSRARPAPPRAAGVSPEGPRSRTAGGMGSTPRPPDSPLCAGALGRWSD